MLVVAITKKAQRPRGSTNPIEVKSSTAELTWNGSERYLATLPPSLPDNASSSSNGLAGGQACAVLPASDAPPTPRASWPKLKAAVTASGVLRITSLHSPRPSGSHSPRRGPPSAEEIVELGSPRPQAIGPKLDLAFCLNPPGQWDFMLSYVQKKAAKAGNGTAAAKVLQVVLCCLQSCLWCVERCMKFLNKNAYIQARGDVILTSL